MQVMPREKLALIDPSGSGKTTILRILMTLEHIDCSQIQIDGEHLHRIERSGQLLPAAASGCPGGLRGSGFEPIGQFRTRGYLYPRCFSILDAFSTRLDAIWSRSIDCVDLPKA